MKYLPILSAAALALLAIQPSAAKTPKAPVIAAGDYRTADPQNLLVVDTEKGRIIVELYPEIAPIAVDRIKSLARAKFYDGLAFHRVIDDFMAQGGDPKGDGTGSSGRPPLNPEFTVRRGADMAFNPLLNNGGQEDGFFKALPMRSQSSDLMVMMADGKVPAWGLWCPGVAGMARTNDPVSADSQFFLMRGFNEQLEQKYTVFGRVLVGLDVVRNLAVGEPPPHPDHMKSVRVMADLPADQQTKIQVLDTTSASFKALVAYDKTQHGGSFSVCDVDLPVLQ
jgi:peptidylprolyl isomerase